MVGYEVYLVVGLGEAGKLKETIVLVERKICKLCSADDDNFCLKYVENINCRTIPFKTQMSHSLRN